MRGRAGKPVITRLLGTKLILALALWFPALVWGQAAHYANRNEVRACELAPGGEALWYATGGGLVRLDLGLDLYVVFSRGEGVPSADLTALAVLPDGRLLAGSDQAGVILKTTAGRWIALGTLDGVPDQRILHLGLSSRIAPVGVSLFWVGTPKGARLLAAGESFVETLRDQPLILQDEAIYDIEETTVGAFFASDGAVWLMRDNGEFTRFGLEQGVPPLAVTEIETGPDAAVYLAAGSLIARLGPAGFSRVEVPFGDSRVTDLRLLKVGSDSYLAAAAAGKVYLLDSSGAWRSLPVPADDIAALGPIPPGLDRPVLGSSGGGLYYPDRTGGWANLRLPGPLFNVLTNVAVDSRGVVWTSSAADIVPRSRAGVNRFDGDTWTSFTESDSPLLMNMVSSLDVAPDGRLYLGTWFGPSVIGSGGFNILDDRGTADPADDRWETYTANQTGLSMDVIRGDMAFDSRGGAWIGSLFNQDRPGGLEYFDPVQQTFAVYSPFLAERAVRTVAVDGLANVWIGYANRGLAVIPGGFSSGRPPHDLATFRAAVGDVGIVDLEADTANRLWIATAGKVVLLNFQEDAADESKFSYSELKPPDYAGLAANAIAVEGTRAVWFATNSGIFRTDFSGLGQTWDVFDR
ncbi:MAG: hypothetical protein V1794_18200, partial [Candidatus Glassbacteria bacterium]